MKIKKDIQNGKKPRFFYEYICIQKAIILLISGNKSLAGLLLSDGL